MMKDRLLAGRLVESIFESQCLSGNPLGDPTRRSVIVYLPPGYDETTRYPLVLMLPAFAATHRSALGFDPWKLNTVERLDRQIRDGECEPCILALPDCMTRWGGSQYVDSTGQGRYQTYVADEVIGHLDATFRTIPTRDGRAAVGRSSGGFGALRLAMDRPEIVSAVASHAGDAAFDVSMRPMLTRAAIAYDQAGGLPSFAKALSERGPKGAFEFDGVFVLASAASYGSWVDAFPHCEVPMNPRTGALVTDRWSEWLENDPVERIVAQADALRSMTTIFVDAGETDEHGLQFAARSLADRLAKIGANVVHEEHAGGHRGTSWRYADSIPRMVRDLAKG